MESVLMTHPETAMPFCVQHYRLYDEAGQLLYEKTDNYQALNIIRFDQPIQTQQITLELLATHGDAPAALFEIRCYESR